MGSMSTDLPTFPHFAGNSRKAVIGPLTFPQNDFSRRHRRFANFFFLIKNAKHRKTVLYILCFSGRRVFLLSFRASTSVSCPIMFVS